MPGSQKTKENFTGFYTEVNPNVLSSISDMCKQIWIPEME